MEERREPEVWKPIPEYEGLYEVSSWGRVKSVERFNSLGQKLFERILKNGCHNEGYLKTTIFKKGVRKKCYIHVLVVKAFLLDYFEGCEVNHKDANRSNNYYKNLEIVNRRENVSYYSRNSNLSGYVGVSKTKYAYVAEIRIDNRRIYLGSFKDPLKAHKAYLDALKEHGLTNKYATENQE